VHRDTTAEEIWHDTGGQVDVFVSAVGTGGTLTGVGEVLKARRPAVHCVAVEPHTAAVLSGRPAGPHKIPGIGVGFVPPVLNRSVIDEILTVSDEDAFAAARRLAHEGVLAGASSGAALHAAIVVAGRPEMDRKNIVVLLADSAERYVTTDLVVR
jgi:cysteine synthase A